MQERREPTAQPIFTVQHNHCTNTRTIRHAMCSISSTPLGLDCVSFWWHPQDTMTSQGFLNGNAWKGSGSDSPTGGTDLAALETFSPLWLINWWEESNQPFPKHHPKKPSDWMPLFGGWHREELPWRARGRNWVSSQVPSHFCLDNDSEPAPPVLKWGHKSTDSIDYTNLLLREAFPVLRQVFKMQTQACSTVGLIWHGITR